MSLGLSTYILTNNSEQRLRQVLAAVSRVTDELIVVDSGSTDGTLSIAKEFNAKILYRKFDNFRDQRVFGEEACSRDWILAVDSDEVLSDELVNRINQLKEEDFLANRAAPPDGFALKRHWFFLGKRVHAFYPVQDPEYIVRLFKRDKISTKGSRIIHESLNLDGCKIDQIEEPIDHFSCDSIDDLYSKIGLYTKLSAEHMHASGELASWTKIHVYPWLIWALWYFLKGSWKDGERGRILSKYIRTTIYLKYLKLKHLDMGVSL